MQNSNIVTTYINFRNSDTVTSTINPSYINCTNSDIVTSYQIFSTTKTISDMLINRVSTISDHDGDTRLQANEQYEIMTSGNDTKAIHVTMFISSSPRGHALALYITNQQSGASREARN